MGKGETARDFRRSPGDPAAIRLSAGRPVEDVIQRVRPAVVQDQYRRRFLSTLLFDAAAEGNRGGVHRHDVPPAGGGPVKERPKTKVLIGFLRAGRRYPGRQLPGAMRRSAG